MTALRFGFAPQFRSILFLLALLLGATAPNTGAITINRTSDSVIYIDVSARVWCTYVSYQIINQDGVNYSNLWVKLDSFSGPIIRLGGGDSGEYNLGNLPNNQTNTVFFYLHATNTTAAAQTHTVKVFRGRPDVGTQLTNQNFTLTVSSSGQNNSTKINTVTGLPNPPTVGGLLLVTIAGTTGQIGGPNKVNFSPSVYTNWDASAYQLEKCSIDVSGGNTGSYSNLLTISFGSSVDTAYLAKYWYRAVSVTGTSNSVSPLTTVSGGGGQFSHASPPSAGVIAPILPATNLTVLANLASVSQLYTNEIATFTVRILNNSTNDISLDSVVNTLPPGFTYIPNTTRFNGFAAVDPDIGGSLLTWSERYDVPAGGSRDLTFDVTPSSAGYATNRVVAFSKLTQIDTTIDVSDNAPATSVVRILNEPSAAPDTGTLTEDDILSVAAPGVLDNDTEPNGFSKVVTSYTQPTNGSVVVNPNGSWTYTPDQDFSGTDSFSYTFTNGNARSASAIVNLTITAVNDPPTLDEVDALSVDQDAGEQTILLSGITPGPVDESDQTVSITATSSNPALIPHPVVEYTTPSTTGALRFTPAPGSTGVTVISIVVSDDGGIANGGLDTITNTVMVGVGSVITVWGPDEQHSCHVNDALGQPGIGYDLLNLPGTLDIQATPANPFTIELISLDQSSPGLAENFDYAAARVWTIATASSGVTGFDPLKFLVDTARFSNDLAGGVFSVALGTDGKSVEVHFTPNQPPAAGAPVYGRAWGTFVRIPIAALLAAHTSDPDGDPRALVSAGASTNGAWISTNAAFILFAPTNNLVESFPFVVRDLRAYRPGDTILTATNWIMIPITNAVSSARSIVPGSNGSISVSFAGVPGYGYAVERSTNLSEPDWTIVLSTNAPSEGVWIYTEETPPVPAAWYRLRQQP